ncbi:MAG: hypothetical protein HN348_31290, partial [Proteobacteria bacterium]|nr:hypothetical protein [Pseudomonadota bacterium]
LYWYAAAGDQLAGPLDEVGHGAFTYLAIGALRGWADGEVDGQRDGQVTAEEAQLYVGRAMRTLQIVGQQPEMMVANGSGEVLLAGSGLEQGPSLDARSESDQDPLPTQETTVHQTTTATSRLDPHSRTAVMDRVQAIVDDCVDRHPPYARTWSVKARFSPKGKVAPVVMASLQSGGTTTMQITVNPVATCIGQGVRALDFTPPESAVSVNSSYTAR